MKIDISNVGNGHELSDYEMNVLKTSHLRSRLDDINYNMKSEFNYLIVSMSVYNAIECNPRFKPSYTEKVFDGPHYIGMFGTFECYVDLLLPSNMVLMQYDKRIARDKKIDTILNDVDVVTEVEVTINGL